MLKHYFFTFCCFLFFLNANAQSQEPYHFEQLGSFEIGTKRESILFQLDYHHLHRLDTENRFKIGYGLGFVRFRNFDDLPYTNSEADDNFNVGLDTFRVVNAKISSLNLFLLLNYAPNKRMDIGISLDLLGVSWGSNQKGLFATGPDDPSVRGAEAKPKGFNTFFSSSGSWRSQFYLHYWMYPRWSLQTGLVYWHSAYKITEEINLDHKAYDHGLLFWEIGLGFRLGKQAS